jgi:hypothetical protein
MMKSNIKLGDNEIKVPSYMTSLPQSFIDILGNEKDCERVVSCGVDPIDNSLQFITSNSYVGIIEYKNDKHKPVAAIPSWNGDRVFVSFEDDLGIQGFDSIMLKSISDNAFTKGIVSVNDRYVCDIDLGKEVAHEDANNQTP